MTKNTKPGQIPELNGQQLIKVIVCFCIVVFLNHTFALWNGMLDYESSPC